MFKYYSSVLIFVVICNFSLSGAQYERYRRNPSETYDDIGVQGVNIGNGVNKKNNVIIENRQDNFQYTNTGGRSVPHSAVNNIGNGMGNQNTVMLSNGNPRRPQNGDYDSWNNGGTTVVRNRNDGTDVFHVGYGPDNRNKVTIDGRDINPDCYGTSCDNKESPRKASGATGRNQAFTLFLTFLNIIFVNLV